MRMKRFFPSLAALLLAACATGSKTDGNNVQVEIDSHGLLGDIAFERQQLDTATNEYLAAALLSDQPALAERATRVAQQVDLTEQGLKAVARWKALAPKDERPLWFAGVFETRAHRIDKATAEFETFIRELGDPATGFALVLEALADEPKPKARRRSCARSTTTFPGVPAGQYALARLALRSGDFDLALTNAKAAADSDPNWLEAQLLYARSLLVSGKTDESLAIAARLADQHPETQVQLQYAELLLSAGKPRDAEARLNDILAKNPGNPEAVRALAFLALTEQRLDEAKDALRRAARRSELSSRGFLLPRPHRGDRAGLPPGDALVRSASPTARTRSRRSCAPRGSCTRSSTIPTARCATCATSARRIRASRRTCSWRRRSCCCR